MAKQQDDDRRIQPHGLLVAIILGFVYAVVTIILLTQVALRSVPTFYVLLGIQVVFAFRELLLFKPKINFLVFVAIWILLVQLYIHSLALF